MTKAVCQQCGQIKPGSFIQCFSCGFDPATDDELIIALLLSDHYQDEETLEHNRSRILAGRHLQISDQMRTDFLPVIREVKPMLGLAPISEKALKSSPTIFSRFKPNSLLGRIIFSVKVGFYYQRINRAAYKSSIFISNLDDFIGIPADRLHSITMLATWISLFLPIALAKSFYPQTYRESDFLARVSVCRTVLPDLLCKVLFMINQDSTNQTSEQISYVFGQFFANTQIAETLSSSRLDPIYLRQFTPFRCRHFWRSNGGPDPMATGASFRNAYVSSLVFCGKVMEETIAGHSSLQEYLPEPATNAVLLRYRAYIEND
jgi:hypothetical protein